MPSRAGTILLVLAVLFWAEAIASVFLIVPPSGTLFNLSFGYGPYMKQMLTVGQFADCSHAVCDRATKMPFAIMLMSLLGTISQSEVWVAVMKTLLFAFVTILGCSAIWAQQRRAYPRVFFAWVIVLIALLLSLPAAKHIGQITYEEGYSIPLLFMLGLMAPLLNSNRLSVDIKDRYAKASLALGAALYLIKPALLLIFIWTMLAVVWLIVRRGRRSLVLALILALMVPVSWGSYCWIATGRFSVTTSLVGEDMRRAANSDSVKIYPISEVDRVFDTPVVVLPDGVHVAISPKPVRIDFPNEWTWSDYNRGQAQAWVAGHPGEWALFVEKKIHNYFFSFTKTPEQVGATPLPVSRMTVVQNMAISFWLVIGRTLALLFAVLWIRRWRNVPEDRIQLLFVLGLNAAYLAPCLVGYNYERHVTTGLVLALACLVTELAIALESLPASAMRFSVRHSAPEG